MLLAPICFIKLLKDYSRALKKKENLPVAHEYVLLVHLYLLEYTKGHLKILSETVRLDSKRQLRYEYHCLEFATRLATHQVYAKGIENECGQTKSLLRFWVPFRWVNLRSKHNRFCTSLRVILLNNIRQLVIILSTSLRQLILNKFPIG
jgi:hypothetical protein